MLPVMGQIDQVPLIRIHREEQSMTSVTFLQNRLGSIFGGGCFNRGGYQLETPKAVSEAHTAFHVITVQ